MQVKVPQDVQRADRILGPLTIKQLGLMIGGGLIAWLFYSVLIMPLNIVFALIVVLITLAFVFIKIHYWNFALYLRSMIMYSLKPKVRTWQKMNDHMILPLDEMIKIMYEKTAIKEEVKEKAQKIDKVDDMADLLDNQAGLKNEIHKHEDIDSAHDEHLLQTAYFGKEHDSQASRLMDQPAPKNVQKTQKKQ